MEKFIREFVTTWETRCYADGIPDECHPDIERNRLAPSYKQIAIAVLRNDLRPLGFVPKKSIFYDMLKKIEFIETNQLHKLK